jgi:hypothetical protein
MSNPLSALSLRPSLFIRIYITTEILLSVPSSSKKDLSQIPNSFCFLHNRNMLLFRASVQIIRSARVVSSATHSIHSLQFIFSAKFETRKNRKKLAKICAKHEPSVYRESRKTRDD